MKEKRQNLYTAIAKAMVDAPHIDTGDNNIYTVLGLKPPKAKKIKKQEDKSYGSK